MVVWRAPLLLMAVLSSSTSIAADLAALSVQVELGGDVRWKPRGCSVEAFGADRALLARGDLEAPIEVPPGRVDVVVSCTASEGVVRRTTRLQVTPPRAGKTQVVPVTLRPGFVTASIERDGQPFSGEVILYDAFQHEVARGKTQTVIIVDAGQIRVVGTVSAGATAPADTQGEVRVTVEEGKKASVVVDASDGVLEVDVRDNGRKADATIDLRVPGSGRQVLELAPNTAAAVPSGTWDLVTRLNDAVDGAEVVTKGVVVRPHAKTTRTVKHRSGTALLQVLRPREPGLREAPLAVEVFMPAADAPFHIARDGETVHLSPGRYDVEARFTEPLDDGSLARIRRTITVGPGSRQRVKLAPAVAGLDVDVRVGGQARALPVSLWTTAIEGPSAQQLVEREADGRGHVHFVVGPQRLEIRASLATAHGPVDVRRTVTLADGPHRERLDINVGTAVMQVIAHDAAVNADVRFFRRLKMGRPDGAPVVEVKAGQEAWLEPGLYVVAVARGGEERLFGEVRIAAGRTVERALDWDAAVQAP